MRSIPIALLAVGLFAHGALAETLELTNGDKVSGEVVERTDAHVVLAHAVFGRIVVPNDQIAPPAPPEPEDAGAFGLGFLRGWTRRISLGASGAEGNTVQAALNAGIHLSQEDDAGRWKFEAEYFWGSSDRTEDTNKAFVDLERDWKFPDSRLYLFTRAGYDYDRFRSFNQRIDGNLGLGYWWIEWPHWRFGTRLGAGVSYQFDGDSAVRPELVGGIDSIWPIAEGHTFEIHADIFPDLADTGEFRTHSTADWNVSLTDVLGLSIGIVHDYVSDTTLKNSDLTYRGALTYDF